MEQIYFVSPNVKVVRRIVGRVNEYGEEQVVVEFTDDTFFCITARTDDEKAMMTSQSTATGYPKQRELDQTEFEYQQDIKRLMEDPTK